MTGPAEALTQALRDVLDVCDTARAADGHAMHNLPDVLSAALTQVGRERGGTIGLIQHRIGSWEAEHVRALAAFADWDHDG